MITQEGVLSWLCQTRYRIQLVVQVTDPLRNGTHVDLCENKK